MRYVLTVRIDLPAVDDVAAKEMGLDLMYKMAENVFMGTKTEAKIQKVFKDKEPCSIPFRWKSTQK